jgi:hypothetical protein
VGVCVSRRKEENDDPEEGGDSGGAVGAAGGGEKEEGRFCEVMLEAFTGRFFPLHGGYAPAVNRSCDRVPPLAAKVFNLKTNK